MAPNKTPFSDNGKPTQPRLLWDDARVFLAIARNRTLSAAAVALGVGVATASRRLDRLEAALGVRLFSRHQSGYRLTDDGSALMAQAEALEQAGHAFGVAAQEQGGVVGSVRLATAENLANPLIIPSLARLLDQHPKLNVEILTDVRTVNLHRRDADLAVRMVKPTRGNVTIRRLGVLGFGLYGSRRYLQNRTKALDRAGFDEDQFVGWSEMQNHLPAAQWIERTLRGRPCRITTTSLSAQIAAAGAGIGLAILPHFLARQAGLSCVLADLGADQTIWLVIHSDLLQSTRVRVVADHLASLFLDKRAELRGEV
ncbi:MAG: LysR family transcriptional regulator [Pseudomonadota bacterium]